MVDNLDALDDFLSKVDKHGNMGTRDKRGAKRGHSGVATMSMNAHSFRAKLRRAQRASRTSRMKKGIP